MLDFEILGVGQLGCNCVILWNTSDKVATLVDPGDEVERISKAVDRLDISVKTILLTHAHFDHVGAAAALQELWNCPVLLHPLDMPLLEQIDEQTSYFRFPPIKKPNASPFSDELPLSLGLMHTPGHSPGSCSFLAETTKGMTLLSGDTLFAGGVGRTDLLGGDFHSLENSIRTKFYTLPHETIVIPGHGPKTTIAAERRGNPHVRG